MKLPQFSRRDLFWLVLVVAHCLVWLREKVLRQVQVAQTNRSWIIAVGDLPQAEWIEVLQRQTDAFDHLLYGK